MSDHFVNTNCYKVNLFRSSVPFYFNAFQDFTAFTAEFLTATAQKMKLSIKDFCSKSDQIRSFLVTFTEEILIENLIFCAISIEIKSNIGTKHIKRYIHDPITVIMVIIG